MPTFKNPFKRTEEKKTYADYVAPLKTMVNNLTNYVDEQNLHIEVQESAKAEIEADIKNSQKEIDNSKKTIDKLSDIVIV